MCFLIEIACFLLFRTIMYLHFACTLHIPSACVLHCFCFWNIETTKALLHTSAVLILALLVLLLLLVIFFWEAPPTRPPRPARCIKRRIRYVLHCWCVRRRIHVCLNCLWANRRICHFLYFGRVRCRIRIFVAFSGASSVEFVICLLFWCIKRWIRDILVIRRRLVSYEVLPPLKISGIAWELRCLNESSVAHHQPEWWAKQVVGVRSSQRPYWGTS
jgi:hypothetical protein